MIRSGKRKSLSEVVLEAIAHAATPLVEIKTFSDGLARRRFFSAIVLGLAAIVVGRLMDLVVFGAAASEVPYFFVLLVGAWLVLALPALLARRLHNAGVRRRSMLLIGIPIVGWVALAWRLGQPTCSGDRHLADAKTVYDS